MSCFCFFRCSMQWQTDNRNSMATEHSVPDSSHSVNQTGGSTVHLRALTIFLFIIKRLFASCRSMIIIIDSSNNRTRASSERICLREHHRSSLGCAHTQTQTMSAMSAIGAVLITCQAVHFFPLSTLRNGKSSVLCCVHVCYEVSVCW